MTRRSGDGDFSLPPRERAMYGATLTARSLDTGATRTFARTDATALAAIKEIVNELDLLAGNFRVVAISTPVSIQRDMFASRIQLDGPGRGAIPGTPEQYFLRKIGRSDMLHPAVVRMSERNAA